jgi:hypothetical protein
MPVINIEFPVFHPGQVAAYRAYQSCNQLAIRCGRRWGKTDFAKTIASNVVLRGQPVGWFTPNYKVQAEAYNEIRGMLDPVVPKQGGSSKTEGVIRAITGGRLDFWSLDNERAGASRKYKLAIIDEAAFTKDNMMAIWERAIKPTLLDLGGKVVALSNANGIAAENFLHQICTVPKYGFKEYHAPTSQNPYIPLRSVGESVEDWQAKRDEVFAGLIRDNHPLVYQQEYLAEFVDFSGVAFFSREKLLVNDRPVPWPAGCDTVLAVIDSAVKKGLEHDGTAVTYYATSSFGEYKLVVLDWDIVSIDGALLESWVPGVFARCQELANTCHARFGVGGVWIEDAASGSILLQQCAMRGWDAQALPAELTAAGKDARAMNASGPVYRGDVKISEYAYDKTVPFKGQDMNHLLSQIFRFRIGDKQAANRADDLLDTFTYSIAITLGNSEGFA